MTEHIHMARLIKPFPVRRLADGLYQVNAGGNLIHQRLTGVLIDQPATKEAWCQELQAIKGMLMGLADACRDAEELVDELWDSADRDYEAGLRVVSSMLRGLSAYPPVPVTAEEDEQWKEREAV